MKYSLRSLMIVAVLAPPVLAAVYSTARWLSERPRGVDLGGMELVYEVDMNDSDSDAP